MPFNPTQTLATTHRTDKQIERQVDTLHDTNTGQVLARQETTWTYYPTGEVDIMTVTDDAGGTRVIKHYLDGRQPTTTIDKRARLVLIPLQPTPTPEPEPEVYGAESANLTPEEKAPIERGVRRIKWGVLIIGILLGLLLAALALHAFIGGLSWPTP